MREEVRGMAEKIERLEKEIVGLMKGDGLRSRDAPPHKRAEAAPLESIGAGVAARAVDGKGKGREVLAENIGGAVTLDNRAGLGSRVEAADVVGSGSSSGRSYSQVATAPAPLRQTRPTTTTIASSSHAPTRAPTAMTARPATTATTSAARTAFEEMAAQFNCKPRPRVESLKG
jgi:hypothetical protein